MGLLAVKHLDPVVGIDVHSVLVAPSPTPVFLPHPHVGFMLDLREYIEAAKGVVGSIAMAIAQEKAAEYLEDHPDVAKKLDDAAEFASGKLTDIEENSMVAEGLKLEQQAAALQSRIGNMFGAGVGMGGAAGRPIFVNGLMRATAGTHSYHVPGLHFPLGESFAPPPEPDPIPSDDAESYMGSRTVLANNDPMSFMALPALSCWSIGLEPPGHNSAHTDRTYPSMPSSVMLPIPAGRPVMVGGPPIMNMAAAAKGLFKAFQGSKWAHALADKLHLKPGFLRCNVLKAEPVDVTTGQVVVQQRDFTISGRLPLVWERHYASNPPYEGVAGTGWQTPADIRLELIWHEGAVGAVANFPDHSTAFDVLPASHGWPVRVYDWQRGYALYQYEDELTLRTREGIEYDFALPPQWRQTVRALPSNARLTLQIERIADLNGNAWVFERDALGCLERISEWTRDGPTARTLECSLRNITNADPDVRSAACLASLALRDGTGRTHFLVTYEHDDCRDLRAAVDAMTQPHRFDYTDAHLMVGHTSARGVSFYYSYRNCDDGKQRVERAWGDDGLFDYRFSYDPARREARFIDSRGYTTIMQLNARNMPVAEIDPLNGVTSYQYDPQGRTNRETDPEGHTTTWCYDTYGNFLSEIHPNGDTRQTEYDKNHRPICLTTPGGKTWRYEWDHYGNLVAQMTPSRAISRYTYDAYGQLTSFTDPRGATTRIEFDSDGNLAFLTDPLGHRIGYTHDGRGNIVQVIDPLGQVYRYEYDRNDNLIRAVEPDAKASSFSYDADGNLTCHRDPAGNATWFQYTMLGQISKRLAADGTVVEYLYDSEEDLVGVVNERGEHHTLKRDPLARIVEEIDYWGQSWKYQYHPNGALFRSTDPRGQEIEYVSDARGRVVEKRIADSRQASGVRSETFRYDQDSNLVQAHSPDCSVYLEYDLDGRVLSEKQGDDFCISFAYDPAGNRIERRTSCRSRASSNSVRYTYDALNSISSVQINDAAPILNERDGLGQIVREQLGAYQCRELTYGPDGLLTTQKLLTDTGPLFVNEYAYDANGELVEKRDSLRGTERIEYDPLGRVTSHIDPAGKLHRFIHDKAGDLLRTRAGVEATRLSNRIKNTTFAREGEYGGRRYTFDRAGNLVRRQDSVQDSQFYWDGDGLLIEARTVQRTMDEVLSTSTQYTYDAFHRRVGKFTRKDVLVPSGQRSGTATSSTIQSRFMWDGDALAAEIEDRIDDPDITGTGDVRELKKLEWIYFPGTFNPLAVTYNTSEELYFFHLDANGAPTRMTDASGSIVWNASYTILGQANKNNGNSIYQPLRLFGQYHDIESGLHYNRYRYFDPEVGIYISQDPIGLDGGINPYELAVNLYGWNDPLGLRRRSRRSYAGKQPRLKALADDDKQPSYIRGWIRQETYAIETKSRNQLGNEKKTVRVPYGFDMAHWRGYESAKGFDYLHTDLNTTQLHQRQHKYDDHGSKNKKQTTKRATSKCKKCINNTH
ncbi:RHS repeat-associated core domain-containing protein [Burkholderia ambifaria]|uniref:RHS repeat-associated core domain-containing protein n=1 Tax=Burkholderia ambifaria TaxID=152480 RepID=UPI00158CFB5C|nr:RHS repeat-associated core domain-containing protein [Burkholderia ambifaria]